MSIYRPNDVAIEPNAVLVQFAVYEIPAKDGSDKKEHHFVGYNLVTGDGRVSSRIVSYDKGSRTGVTRSGRTYKLSGEPGTNGDAEYVWSIWRNASMA